MIIFQKINYFKLLLTLFLLSYSSLFIKVKAQDNQANKCVNSNLEASFELDDSWIYICNQNQEKTFHQISKNNQEIITIPASGNFPTFAAIEGELSDPNSKIYNISPYDFKIIQASIIQKIEPVIKATYKPKEVNVTVLSGAIEQQAIAICNQNGNKQPVQVFDAENDKIYICISAPENDENAIDLTYIQQSKTNPSEIIILPADLSSSFTYTAKNHNHTYLISYQGLEIYEKQVKISSQSVTHVYLVTSDANHEDTH